jgi:hypothetical protein
MKGEKAALWKKISHPGAPGGKAEMDMGHAGRGGMGGTTISTHGGDLKESISEADGHKNKMDMTLKDVGAKDSDMPKVPKSKNEHGMDDMGTDVDHESQMAQPSPKIGQVHKNPRKGY